jgi:NAD(P)-dependent dehydrogenase (short-subunit alcohol dehydrogenase family)
VDLQHRQDSGFGGQTALVTGASRGLGREIARRLAEMGASVGVNYVSHSAEAEGLVNEIRASGGQALAVQADVGEPSQVHLMTERVTAELGPVSLLVNNAGVLFRGTLESFDPEDMQRMWRTNVDGVVHVTRAVVPGMKARCYGRIVNVSSIAAHGTAMPGTTFYAAAKATVLILTRRFALELGREGITVNAVAPGFILTDMVRQGLSEQEYQAVVQKFAELSMVGRVGKPTDVANAVAFLLAQDSGFITGQILTVDGGRTDYIGHP